MAFPYYFSTSFSFFFLPNLFDDFSIKDLLWGFYITNTFMATPLIGGILADSVGAINLLALIDVLLIIGQACILASTSHQYPNEFMCMIGLFFTYFSVGLKNTTKEVFYGNTFIQRIKGKFSIQDLSIQKAISFSIQSLTTMGFYYFIENFEVTEENTQIGALISLALSVLVMIFDIMMFLIIKSELKDIDYGSASLLHHCSSGVSEGCVFNFYNDRTQIPEIKNPHPARVIRNLFQKKLINYLKYWIGAMACFIAAANFVEAGIVLWAKYYISYPSQIIIFLVTGIFFYTEKKLRFILLLMGLLLLIYELYYALFQSESYVQWIQLVAIPAISLGSSLHLPILLNFDLNCLGTMIGIMAWLQGLLQFISTFTTKAPFLILLISLGMIMLLIFNEKYLTFKELGLDPNKFRLLDSKKDRVSILKEKNLSSTNKIEKV
jgi:hypothetical protein